MAEVQRVALPRSLSRHACVAAVLHADGAAVARGAAIVRIDHDVPATLPNRDLYPDAADAGDGFLRVRDAVTSPYTGELRVLVAEGERVAAEQPLFEVTEACGHSVQFSGMCALCGQEMRSTDPPRAPISMVRDTFGITVSSAKARELDAETAARLHRQRKLSLILDLDQTLIHATADPAVGAWLDAQDDPPVDTFRFRLANDPHDYFLRLRPFLREFLAQVAPLYELHIYTMGSRSYANKVASLIDPDKKYFSERILSRDESGSFERKSLERLFPCDQSMVVAIDDRGDVWDWAENLIRVHPYSYFLRTGDINAPLGVRDMAPDGGSNNNARPRSSSSAPVKLVDDDRELHVLQGKLRELHTAFYQNPANADVRHLLPRMKRRVLAGCHVVFSGVIPKQIPEQDATPWRLAEDFGATCHPMVSDKITHCVAMRLGSAKTKRARKLGLPIVTPAWLYTSVACWTRAEEARFLLVGDDPEDEDDADIESGLASTLTDQGTRPEGDGDDEDDIAVDDELEAAELGAVCADLLTEEALREFMGIDDMESFTDEESTSADDSSAANNGGAASTGASVLARKRSHSENDGGSDDSGGAGDFDDPPPPSKRARTDAQEDGDNDGASHSQESYDDSLYMLLEAELDTDEAEEAG